MNLISGTQERKDQDRNKIKYIEILYCMSGGGLFMA